MKKKNSGGDGFTNFRVYLRFMNNDSNIVEKKSAHFKIGSFAVEEKIRSKILILALPSTSLKCS